MKNDKALGMDEPISRRDYLNSALIGSGGLLLSGACPLDLLSATNPADWNGYGGTGDYSGSNGNTWEVMTAGHKIRDRVFEPLSGNASSTGEVYDCVVVGGGISGLAAALAFQRRAGAKGACLVLENHAIFGGEARVNEFRVDGRSVFAHQGSAMFFPQMPGTSLAAFYESIGIDSSGFHYQQWQGRDPEMKLPRTPYTTGGETSAFFFGPKFGTKPGMLLKDPYGTRLEGAPISEQARRELIGMREKSSGGSHSRPQTHGDEISRRLDSITLEEDLMAKYDVSRETVRTFLSPVSGGGSGVGADALSAYAEYAADVLLPWDYSKGAQMFPGGNAGVARHILKALLPDAIPSKPEMDAIARSAVNFAALDRPHRPMRIRLGATVVSVEHEGKPEQAEYVRIIYARQERLHSVRARSVIVAGGSWTAKHIIKGLPRTHRDAYAQFHRAPCLMANVALRNWRFLYRLGINECQWFEGIGNYFAIHKTAAMGRVSPVISPDSPVVLTLKILFSSPGLPLAQQVTRGRGELFATPYREYERRIREQLSMMFSNSGFEAKRDIAGLILNRWGHAYLSAQPGFFFGKPGMPAPGEVLRKNPFGRIAFANSDVTGIMDHRASIQEAQRAVQQVVTKP
ncbi:MAG TPA: NAD(P)-binding protein [Bryobacteraceae bacterium]|nr:NAD(P)-binding protein [Bryobacteraceae bacterium]